LANTLRTFSKTINRVLMGRSNTTPANTLRTFSKTIIGSEVFLSYPWVELRNGNSTHAFVIEPFRGSGQSGKLIVDSFREVSDRKPIFFPYIIINFWL
jgi:hypothetical protein